MLIVTIGESPTNWFVETTVKSLIVAAVVEASVRPVFTQKFRFS